MRRQVMGIKEMFDSSGPGLKERALEKKAEKLAEENRALKERSSLLKSELDSERATEDQLLSALKSKGRRRPRLLRTVFIAGTAYVLGTKAGRGRYEQMMRWWRSMRDRAVRTPAGEKVQEIAGSAAAKVQDQASTAAAKLQDKARAAESA
jgi:hypothetical protein